MSKALLFINGEECLDIPKDLKQYSIICCTDGAYSRYAKKLPIKFDFISGDFDSITSESIDSSVKVICTPDQNKTDFHKALEILLDNNIIEVDIYGGTGRESDHFIGNLSTALYFKEKLKITFYDDFSKFFFSNKYTLLHNVKGKIISLIPFFKVENISTLGLKYTLTNDYLTFSERIGTRNIAESDTVEISHSEGELLIYIGK